MWLRLGSEKNLPLAKGKLTSCYSGMGVEFLVTLLVSVWFSCDRSGPPLRHGAPDKEVWRPGVTEVGSDKELMNMVTEKQALQSTFER
jgi:hypothetical protein